MSEVPEPDEHIICPCGANILSRRYRAHCSNKKHKYLVGLISKEEFEEYDARHRARYKNLDEEKKQQHRDKAREYQRAKTEKTNGAYYAEKRLDYVMCKCGSKINKTYSKAHYTSQKHIHGLAGTVPPKRSITRKPKQDVVDSDIELMTAMQAMIE